MSDEQLESRLRQAALSEPSIRFEHLAAWHSSGTPRRRETGLLRLMAATVLVWVMVFISQAAMAPGIAAFGPPARQVLAERPRVDGAGPGLAYLQQRALLEESFQELQPAQPARRDESGPGPIREGLLRDDRQRFSEVSPYV